MTPTSAPTQEAFEITDPIIYPNPFNPGSGHDVYFGCSLTQDASEIILSIYTAGFRKVEKIEIHGTVPAGRVYRALQAREFNKLASGIYYYKVEATSLDDRKAKTGPGIFMILR
jgi:hypothetical protein